MILIKLPCELLTALTVTLSCGFDSVGEMRPSILALANCNVEGQLPLAAGPLSSPLGHSLLVT